MAVADHRQQAGVAELPDEPPGALVGRRRVVARAHHERRRCRLRRVVRPVVDALRPHRPQGLGEVVVAAVEPEVVEQLVVVGAELEEVLDIRLREPGLERGDREEAVPERVVAPVVQASVVGIDEDPHAGPVPGRRELERLGQEPPGVLAVERDERSGEQVVAVDRARIRPARGQRLGVHAVDEVVEGRPRVPVAEAAGGLVAGAGLEEPPERDLEGLRLLAHRLDRVVGVLVGVQRAVEHEAPGALREERLVGRAEEGPVGEAEVVDPLLAQPLADEVEVPRHVRGRDVREDPRVELDAGVDVGLVAGDEVLAVDGVRARERLGRRADLTSGLDLQSIASVPPVPRGSTPMTS